MGMEKKQELLNFLQTELFNPIINSPYASETLKNDFNHMLSTLSLFSAEGILVYVWNMLANDEVQMIFDNRLLDEGFSNYHDVVHTFKSQFTYDWLLS
ncbi:hypothetical protein CS063_16050 [Sporanaerobium hydrogeniformans]|uniref:Uncharacterized protein n=1 Tax=Sporanaerobium hydrogeniformans TaxID=3072179 RepID=A0AC61D850_9FIRM|nr:hypothetical protein [Sporanaerobium hydrogeniformans]PHV69393.1 hypothetical protein CS063_16050 [Sporanaerobium hydrogeniformans]